jgi:hypothetical protein
MYPEGILTSVVWLKATIDQSVAASAADSLYKEDQS